METVIKQFLFNDYPLKVKLSEKQRKRYFEFKNGNIKSKRKPIWKKCLNPIYKDLKIIKPQMLCLPFVVIGYKGNKMIGAYAEFDNENNFIKYSAKFIPFNNIKLTKTDKSKKTKYIVTDIEKGKVIANPTQAGTPNYKIIRGQDIYSGLNEHLRIKIVEYLKEYYYNIYMKKYKDYDYLELAENFPLKLKLTIFDTLDNYKETSKKYGSVFDVGNKGYPYIKTFSDFISNNYKNFNKIIPDDEKLYIYGETVEFHPIENREDRLLLFSLIANDDIKKQYEKIIKWRNNN